MDKGATVLPALSSYPPNVYMGVGLCNQHTLTRGLPIDVLAMILTAHNIGGRKYLLLADAHAHTNGFNASDIEETAATIEQALRNAISGMTGWTILRSTQIAQDPTYNAILSTIEQPHEYMRLQTADAIWFNRHRNVNLKLGWRLSGSRNSDELSFDRSVNLPGFGFVYVECGKTFDPKVPRAPPYFCHDPNSRILLDKSEEPARKIQRAIETYGQDACQPYLNFLKRLVRLYEKAICPLPAGPVQQKLSMILEHGYSRYSQEQ